MALDYKKIRDDKEGEYGTKVGNYGRLLANLYSDRTHFIFELLQNAEDALKNRGSEWQGPRAVSFRLTSDKLGVGHFGRPFNEADVRGICEIGESAKAEDLTAIGRFGIGFKSVYAITELPEIHSGPEDFVIKNYVFPEAASHIEMSPDETVILLPLKSNRESVYGDIAEGLERLGASSLLFLRQIEEISWEIEDGRRGHYLRESDAVDEDVRRVTIIGQVFGEKEINTEWLVFSRQVTDDLGSPAGHVEIAFFMDPEHQSIQPVSVSPLVVFFPTALETHLGFLMQGPYQTTPSRDNVPPYEPWNKRLVSETATLLPKALRWLRDENCLTTDVLRCLPLDSKRFGAKPDLSSYRLSGSGFSSTRNARILTPLFDVTKQALSSEPLLPRVDGGYVAAEHALLGRTEAIRQLFSAAQLSVLYDKDQELAWLSNDITPDRAPDIRNYLMGELDVEEVDPETIIRRLSRTFLEEQSDNWILKLYEFLNGQPAIIRMLTGQFYRSYNVEVPLIRLADGSHVCPKLDGQPQAFLPSEDNTDFPTVRPAVCTTNGARDFLLSLGLKEPDLVDDVLRHILPKYQEKGVTIGDDEYNMDIARILRAFATDSNTQRQELVTELRGTKFVRSRDARTAKKWWVNPDLAYLATSRLKELFSGVQGVHIVDDNYDCLRGEGIRDLLEECGATRYLKPVDVRTDFDYAELRDMRRKAGNENSSGGERVKDHSLRGLDELLAALPQFDSELGSKRAKLLWEALVELEDRRGASVFSGTYSWRYYDPKRTTFDAAFVRKLNGVAWVRNKVGELDSPAAVLFDELGWQESSFLQSKIQFKPPIVQELAREAGIEPEALELIREHGVTTNKLRKWLGVQEELIEGDVKSEPPESEGGGRGRGGRDDSGHIGDEVPEGAIGFESGSPSSESTSTGANEFREPFARKFFGAQTTKPLDTSERPVVFPPGGPTTEKAAREHTRHSRRVGRSEAHVARIVALSELGPKGKALGDEFRDMVKGDYGKRCQVCSKTFTMHTGQPQVYVVHVVPPSADDRTNDFGDLLGLCGWHYSLVRYGEWVLVHPGTGEPVRDWEHMKGFLLNVSKKEDEADNSYFAVPIRFWNVYQEWKPEPVTIDEEIRYSIPHWEYLCNLLKA